MDSVDNRKALEGEQLKRLRLMLQAVLPPNEFYRKKFSALGACEINSMQTLKSLPFTTKNELVEDQMGQVSAALLKQQSPSASQILPLADRLLTKYNDALKLVAEGVSAA